MKLGVENLISRVKHRYDKVIAFFVVLVLLSSVILLTLQVMIMRQEQADFEAWMQGLRPLNEHAEPVDAAPYAAAQAALATPAVMEWIPDSPDHVFLFVPETRFNCRECRHPVAAGAEVCPFCQTPVETPEPKDIDHSGDGIPTWWKRQYGLDPYDPSDAHEDLDGDGFSNIEEYLAKTDPTDPASHPPLIDRLFVVDVTGKQFALQFMSRARTQDGGYRFGLNYALPDGQTKTSFVQVGNIIEGFRIEKYEEKIERAEPPTLGTVDRSELTLLTPKGERIVLVLRKTVQHVELRARMEVELIKDERHWNVLKGETFTLDGIAYDVIDIDAGEQHVILRTTESGEIRTIRSAPADRSGD